MTHYRVTIDLTCPSNWIDGDVRRHVERQLASLESERSSIKISSLDPDPVMLTECFSTEQGICSHRFDSLTEGARCKCGLLVFHDSSIGPAGPTDTA